MSTQHKNDMDLLERVENNVTKVIGGLQLLSYEDRMKLLKRRLREDLSTSLLILTGATRELEKGFS